MKHIRYGQKRVVKKFIWLPTTLPYDINRNYFRYKWFEFAYVNQIYSLTNKWTNESWAYREPEQSPIGPPT